LTWSQKTKKVVEIHLFATGIYSPSSDQRFRRYGFLLDHGAAENCNSGQIAALKVKYILGLIGWDSSPELNTKKVDNSSIFPLVTYTTSSEQQFRSYRILRNDNTAEI
jgi:hypothetical protein